jgi:hypothetical protein
MWQNSLISVSGPYNALSEEVQASLESANALAAVFQVDVSTFINESGVNSMNEYNKLLEQTGEPATSKQGGSKETNRKKTGT